MGQINVVGIEYALSDGRVLLSDVSFRVGEGSKVALIGPNGSGKTTLFRMIAGDITADSGQIIINGGLGVMRQFIGSIRDESTVRDLLISVSPLRIRQAAQKLKDAESEMEAITLRGSRWHMPKHLLIGEMLGDMSKRCSGILLLITL